MQDSRITGIVGPFARVYPLGWLHRLNLPFLEDLCEKPVYWGALCPHLPPCHHLVELDPVLKETIKNKI